MDARVKPGHDTGCFFRHKTSRSRDMFCPRFAFRLPPRKQRAQGRPGARCTRGLACNCAQKTRTRAYRFSGNTPAFPAQWLYGLLRALPGERLSCHRRRAKSLRNLTPAPRRQDHTTSPYASRHPRQSWHPRPPQPVPTFVTMADAPLLGTGWRQFSFDLPDGLSGKFFARKGWTDFFELICPSGKFHRLHGPARRSDWATTGPHQARIATNDSSAPGTIAPRVYWLPDTVTFWRDI